MDISSYKYSIEVNTKTEFMKRSFGKEVNCYLYMPNEKLQDEVLYSDFGKWLVKDYGREALDIRIDELLKRYPNYKKEHRSIVDEVAEDMLYLIHGGYAPGLTRFRVRTKGSYPAIGVYRLHSDRKHSNRGRVVRYYAGEPMKVIQNDDIQSQYYFADEGVWCAEAKSGARLVSPSRGQFLRFANSGYDCPTFFHIADESNTRRGDVRVMLVSDVRGPISVQEGGLYND